MTFDTILTHPGGAHRDEFLIDSVYSFYASNRAGTALILQRKDLGPAGGDFPLQGLPLKGADVPGADPGA